MSTHTHEPPAASGRFTELARLQREAGQLARGIREGRLAGVEHRAQLAHLLARIDQIEAAG